MPVHSASRPFGRWNPSGPRESVCIVDPYARQFVPGWLYAIIGLFDRIGYAERMGPGVMGFLRVRDRYIDDVLRERLAEGLDQLVILGAGLDARAYRFDALRAARVFEVDHPASQALRSSGSCGRSWVCSPRTSPTSTLTSTSSRSRRA